VSGTPSAGIHQYYGQNGTVGSLIMSGPTREDFAAAIDDYWHGRPPTSLEDVMSLYGVLAVAESGGSLYGTPSTLDPLSTTGVWSLLISI